MRGHPENAGLGQVTLEWNAQTGRGRWYRYGPSGELLTEHHWDPASESWELYRNYIYEPTSGQLIAIHEDPLQSDRPPSCATVHPIGFGSEQGPDYIDVGWDAVFDAAAYRVYKDGQPYAWTSAEDRKPMAS